MAIPTSSITMSGIATELDHSSGSNLKLSELGQDTIILNPGNSRQTFTLTDTVTLSVQDTATADNMNLSSGSVEMSEFGGYTRPDNSISFSSSTNTGTGGTQETGNVFEQDEGAGCFVVARLSSEIYASRVGNDLVWYLDEGNFVLFGSHRKENSTYSGTQEVARLAGIASNTATTVSVDYNTLQNTNGILGQATANSSGSTSSNLTSTNTKIGFDFRFQGTGECVPNGADVIYRFSVDFTVTHPDYDKRVFRFFIGLKGRYSTGNQNCC